MTYGIPTNGSMDKSMRTRDGFKRASAWDFHHSFWRSQGEHPTASFGYTQARFRDRVHPRQRATTPQDFDASAIYGGLRMENRLSGKLSLFGDLDLGVSDLDDLKVDQGGGVSRPGLKTHTGGTDLYTALGFGVSYRFSEGPVALGGYMGYRYRYYGTLDGQVTGGTNQWEDFSADLHGLEVGLSIRF